MKDYTLPSRQHLVEAEYIDGIYDKDGNLAIRGLDEDEKAWLDKFNSEWVNADFYTNEEVKSHQEIAEIIAEQENPNKRDFLLYTYQLIIIEYLKDDVFLQDSIQRKECGKMNNDRNADILNRAITRNECYELMDEIYQDDDGSYVEVNDPNYSLEDEFEGWSY